jgi:hypothetical protein
LPSQIYFPSLIYTIWFIDLASEEFFGWITKRCFDVPKFWRPEPEVDAMAAHSHDGGTPSSRSGRGAKKRAIQEAFKSCFPTGEIPPGMTSEVRNERIFDELKKRGLGKSLPNKRTIERSVKYID